MKKFLVILALGVMLIGCDVVPSKVDANEFNQSIEYLQCQKTGEVYSIIGIRSSGSLDQCGIGFAHIDRDDVTKAIQRQIKGFKDFSKFK